MTTSDERDGSLQRLRLITLTLKPMLVSICAKASVRVQQGRTRMVNASLYFLRTDPIHRAEKPYAFRYEIGTDEVPQSNMEMERRDNIQIADLRGIEKHFTLETHGFTILRLESQLKYEDFYNQKKIGTYFCELEDLLATQLKASTVKVFRHGVIHLREPDL